MLKDDEQRIKDIKAKIIFVQNSISFYPNIPNEYELNDADEMILIFERYALRALYFAEEFIQSINDVMNIKINSRPQNENYATNVDNKIYYMFDAFIVFSKSIMEGNIIKRSKKLNPLSKEYFDKIVLYYNNIFIKKELNIIRDEIIHLNKWGTSLGSIAYFNCNHELTGIMSNYINKSGQKIDLIMLYSNILNKMINVIDEIMGIFIFEYFVRFGVPDKNYEMVIADKIITFENFKIPEYFGIIKNNVK